MGLRSKKMGLSRFERASEFGIYFVKKGKPRCRKTNERLRRSLNQTALEEENRRLNRILELPSSLAPRKRVMTKLVSRETKEVSVTLDPNATSRSLSYWNVDANSWEIASGDYRVYVGASSRDIRLTGNLHVHAAEKKEVR